MDENSKLKTEQIDRYVVLTSDLDKVLSELTKDICAYECPRVEFEGEDSLRCCSSKGVYRSGIYSNEFLERQMAEAIDNGWSGPTTDGCKYLVDGEGCSLKTYKSPVCIGFVCPGVMDVFDDVYGSEGYEFRDKMMSFACASDLVDESRADKAIEKLEVIVNIGNQLINMKKENEVSSSSEYYVNNEVDTQHLDVVLD